MADLANNITTPDPDPGAQACLGCQEIDSDSSGIPTTPIAPLPVPPVDSDISGIPTTPIAPDGYPVDPDISGIPTTPIAPLPIPPVDSDISGIPTTPIAPDSYPVAPDYGWPVYPLPTPGLPSTPYYGQVRFLNASTNGSLVDVYVDNRSVMSGSSFATVSIYVQVPDGFHTVTVRQSNAPRQILYQQTQAFVSGEKMTMVILDVPGGVTVARVSDMGCTNIPAGYGCIRAANMSYNGSNYDIKLFNNQVVFANVGYKETTSYKQAAAGNYTFFVTNAQPSVTILRELPVIIFTNLTNQSCTTCNVSNPLLTYNLNVQAGRSYTSYIIGNSWSNLFRVLTLED